MVRIAAVVILLVFAITLAVMVIVSNKSTS